MDEHLRSTPGTDRVEPQQGGGETPTQRAIGLVLMGLRAGLAADVPELIDDHNSIDVAVAVAVDLLQNLGPDGASWGATETGGPGTEGEPSVAPEIGASSRQSDTGWHALTETERQVALLIAGGCTNQQAARKLGRSKHTIGTHLRSTFVKMQVQSRVQLTNALAGRDHR